MDKKGLGCFILFCAPFVLIGLGTFFYSVFNIIRSESTGDWIRVIATVKQVGIESKRNNKGASSSEVQADYEYILEGKKYQGKRIAFGYRRNNLDDHFSIFDKLENANRIVAYVNPDDYSDAVLAKGPNDSVIGIFIFSIMWNALLLFFSPIAVKANRLHRIGVLVAIWFIGFLLFFTRPFHVSMETKIEVVEEKFR